VDVTEPLDTLKAWVMESFEKVKEGGLTPLKFPWDGPVWEPGSFYWVESVKDQHLLALTWPFPCLEAAYLKKPQDYISHLVGHGKLNSSPLFDASFKNSLCLTSFMDIIL
jgi:nardilysin